MTVRPQRCTATVTFQQKVVRCARSIHGEGEHEADSFARCNEPGAPGVEHERDAELTLVWVAS